SHPPPPEAATRRRPHDRAPSQHTLRSHQPFRRPKNDWWLLKVAGTGGGARTGGCGVRDAGWGGLVVVVVAQAYAGDAVEVVQGEHEVLQRYAPGEAHR